MDWLHSPFATEFNRNRSAYLCDLINRHVPKLPQ